MADGEAEGDVVASVFFLVVSFLLVVDSFLEASVDVFLVDDFLVISFFLVVVEAGGVVVDVSVLLVVHEAMSPAANITVME